MEKCFGGGEERCGKVCGGVREMRGSVLGCEERCGERCSGGVE